MQSPHSLTGRYLSGKNRFPSPPPGALSTKASQVRMPRFHNLKKINVEFPVGCDFTCLTGVSGSGKSTLHEHLLRPAVQEALSRPLDTSRPSQRHNVTGIAQFDKILVLDQNPIGHTNRADVETYVDVLTPPPLFLRHPPSPKPRDYNPANSASTIAAGCAQPAGASATARSNCNSYPPSKSPAKVPRLSTQPVKPRSALQRQTLRAILESHRRRRRAVFANHLPNRSGSSTLCSQSASAICIWAKRSPPSPAEKRSGFDSAENLQNDRPGKTLYLMDEPTIGLHSEDIIKLLTIFHTLVDKGNTLIIIEHNLDIIANADYIIDLGPEAAPKAGK